MGMEGLPRIRVGCCGFPVSRREYLQRFPVVEIQQTFYKLPRLKTAEGWRREAERVRADGGRPAFEFTIKAWQLITHEPSSPTYRRLGRPIPEAERGAVGSFRPTEPVFRAWEATAAVARALGAAVIVFQCPPRFTPTPEHTANLRAFFRRIDREGRRMAWEPRGDWPPVLVRDLCAELDLIHVVDPLRQPPQSEGLRYFRLHGVTGYRYLHTDDDLDALGRACAGGAPAYVLFNNLFMGEDAQRFLQRMSAMSNEAIIQ
jgi:uncharacterized protein YecE (DUF72 family)